MLSKSSRWRLGSTLAVLTAIGVAVPSQQASAQRFEWRNGERSNWTSGSHYCKSNGDPMGWDALGCFAPNGDRVQPADLKKDGKRVGVHWKTSYGRHGMCVNSKGKDSNAHPLGVYGADGDYECRIQVKENTRIKIRVGSCNGSKVNCGVLKNWGHWSDWKTINTSG